MKSETFICMRSNMGEQISWQKIVAPGKKVLYFFTYTEWGAILWLAPAWGIVFAYGQRYEFTNPMIVFLCSIWYFIWLIWQRGGKNKKQSYIYAGPTISATDMVRQGITSSYVQAIIVGLLLVLASMGYYHTKSEIDEYYEVNPYYMGAEGIYTVRVLNLPESVILQDKEFLRFEGDLVTMIPKKEATESKPLKADGQLMVYVAPTEAMKAKPILPGQYVMVKGRTSKLLQAPEEGRIDLRPRYLAAHRVGNLYEGTFEGFDTAVRPNWYERINDRIDYLLGVTRWQLMNQIAANLPGEMAAVGQSLLLGGGYGAIDASVMDSFAKTGLIHILSVSGSHVALLFGFVFVVAHIMGVPKKKATYGAIVFVILYCAIVGFNPPVVRSAVMGIIMGIALIRGEVYHSRQALNISAALMLAYEPLLFLDISFQLSLGATYGILLFSRTLYQRLPKGWPYIMGPISLCLSAQILIWPLQLYYFHLMGYGSFLAAVIVGPLLDLAILATAVLLLLHWLIPVGSLWYLLGLLLRLSLFLNSTIASLPGAVMWLGALPVWLGTIYVICCRHLYAIMHEWRVRSLFYENITMSLLFIVLLLPLIHLSSEQVFIHTIPVNRGAAFLVIKEEPLKTAKAFLYMTTGGKGVSNMTRSSIVNSVHYYGIERLNGVIMQEVNEGNEKSIITLLHSLEFPVSAIHKSDMNQDTYIGRNSADFDKLVREYPNQILVEGPRGGFLFGNGQISENNLKLIETKQYIVGTTNSATASRGDDGPSGPVAIVYWPSSGNYADVDPADSTRYITGTRVVPDFLL